MLTMALYGLLAVLVAGALFLAASYLLPAGEQIAPPIRDEPIWDLPAEKRLDFDDVTSVRLPVALRGYRFAETDLLLDRLADELRTRDEEIARLRGRGGAGAAADELYEPAPTGDAGGPVDGAGVPGAAPPVEAAADRAGTPDEPGSDER